MDFLSQSIIIGRKGHIVFNKEEEPMYLTQQRSSLLSKKQFVDKFRMIVLYINSTNFTSRLRIYFVQCIKILGLISQDIKRTLYIHKVNELRLRLCYKVM